MSEGKALKREKRCALSQERNLLREKSEVNGKVKEGMNMVGEGGSFEKIIWQRVPQ